ncbi:MAG: hypothetical protein IJ880_11590 [Bacilli bacterium]|nr:hypothetical protein [Bacilli bacterium]
MSMVTAMDGIGDVNHVDTVHDNVSEEYKQAMEKAMENKEATQVQEPVAEIRPLTEEEQAKQLPPITLDQKGPIDIWLQFDTISVGSGEKRATFDLAKLLAGIEKLADLTMVRQEAQSAEENTTGDIEEVKQEAKWQHNGQPDNPTTNE